MVDQCAKKCRHNTSPDIDNVQCILHGFTINCILLNSATVISEKSLHRRRNICYRVYLFRKQSELPTYNAVIRKSRETALMENWKMTVCNVKYKKVSGKIIGMYIHAD